MNWLDGTVPVPCWEWAGAWQCRAGPVPGQVPGRDRPVQGPGRASACAGAATGGDAGACAGAWVSYYELAGIYN